MANCRKCGRPLKTGESGLCPACKNKRDETTKTGIKWGAILTAVAFGIYKIASGGKGGDKA